MNTQNVTIPITVSGIVFFILLILLFSGCVTLQPKPKIVLQEKEVSLAKQLNIEEEQLQKFLSKPMYELTPKEIDKFLGYLQLAIPELRQRVRYIAKKFLGQPYQLTGKEYYLLGEFPFEIYDSAPLFSIEKSNCVTFAEMVYAMSLGWDWQSFFVILQRIRYKNGEISLLTRNHYTELDWDRNNSWLVEDITQELAKDKSVTVYTEYNKTKFFKKWGLNVDLKESLTWYYIPYEIVPEIIDKLETGDFVNIVRGYDEPNNKWIGHVGLIIKEDDGTVYFLHSAEPKVKMEPLLAMCTSAAELNKKRREYNEKVVEENKKIKEYNKKLREKTGGKPHPKEKKLLSTKPYFYGFKFLRLKENPLEELVKLDGDKTPLVTGPLGVYIKHKNQKKGGE
jgi:hypothetical protein